MEFRRQGEHRALKLPQRSLLIMDDEARLAWAHYIPHRKSDIVESIIVPRAARRISFTFRQVPTPAAACMVRCGVQAGCNIQGGSGSRGVEDMQHRLQDRSF